MIIKHDEFLSNYTTMKIGGKCENLYFPENTKELTELCGTLPYYRIMGGGSNLLINDEVVFDNVICLREFEKNKIEFDGEFVHVGAGVRIQKLIKTINQHSLGGIEYLYSVPTLVGGAVYMNAGRGKSQNKQISDYIVTVRALVDGKIKEFTKDECGFSHRNSVFKNMDCVILDVTFAFEKIEPSKGKELCKQRIEFCKKNQDNKYPNAGTTFCTANGIVMRIAKIFLSSKSDTGVCFSNKTANWLQKRKDGTYAQAMKMLKKVEVLHAIFLAKCKVEYDIWEDSKKN